MGVYERFKKNIWAPDLAEIGSYLLKVEALNIYHE